MKKIGFVGAGSMAEAMINGILQSGITKPEHIYITNRSNDERLIELKETYGVRPCRDKNEFFTHTDIIILAFKPKDAAESIDSIRPYIKDQLVISVLATLPSKPFSIILAESSRSFASCLIHQRQSENQQPDFP